MAQLRSTQAECLVHFSQLDAVLQSEEGAASTNVGLDSAASFLDLAVLRVGNLMPFNAIETEINNHSLKPLFGPQLNHQMAPNSNVTEKNVSWIPMYADLHHSKSFPSLTQNTKSSAMLRNKLSPGRVYQLVFTWDRFERLPAPFDTDCRRYRDGATRQYCLWRCTRKEFLEKTGRIPVDIIPALRSRDADKKVISLYEISNLRGWQDDVRERCDRRCRVECSQVNE